jgi:energy-coupling factor transporter ATP-binding protein EcfA2
MTEEQINMTAMQEFATAQLGNVSNAHLSDGHMRWYELIESAFNRNRLWLAIAGHRESGKTTTLLTVAQYMQSIEGTCENIAYLCANKAMQYGLTSELSSRGLGNIAISHIDDAQAIATGRQSYRVLLCDDPISRHLSVSWHVQDSSELYRKAVEYEKMVLKIITMFPATCKILMGTPSGLPSPFWSGIKHNGMWSAHAFPAINNGIPFWPEAWSTERLDKMLKVVGKKDFSCSYMLSSWDEY